MVMGGDWAQKDALHTLRYWWQDLPHQWQLTLNRRQLTLNPRWLAHDRQPSLVGWRSVEVRVYWGPANYFCFHLKDSPVDRSGCVAMAWSTHWRVTSGRPQ